MRTSWESVQNEAVETLRALVRLDTTNPPGNERIAADYIAEALTHDGIDHVIRESAPTRASLVARIRGGNSQRRRCCSPRTPTWCRSSVMDGVASRSAPNWLTDAYGAAVRST